MIDRDKFVKGAIISQMKQLDDASFLYAAASMFGSIEDDPMLAYIAHRMNVIAVVLEAQGVTSDDRD